MKIHWRCTMSKIVAIVVSVFILVMVLPVLAIGLLNKIDAFLYLSLSIMFKMIGLIFVFGMIMIPVIILVCIIKGTKNRK